MNRTEASQAIQPSIQNDDSFIADQSFTQPDRPSIQENPNYVHLFHLLDRDKNQETPKSVSMMNVSNDHGMPHYEIDSNRSSVLFERSQTQREKQSESKSNPKDDFIKITSLKNLLRLFRVTLNDNDSFELNGQRYLIELDENFNDAATPSHNNHKQHIYAQLDTKSMPGSSPYQNDNNHYINRNSNNQEQMGNQHQNFISPIVYKGENNKNGNSENDISVNMIKNSNNQNEGDPYQINLINIDFQNINLFNTKQSSKQSQNNKNRMNSIDDLTSTQNSNNQNIQEIGKQNDYNINAQDITPIMSYQPSLRKCDTLDREVQVDENLLKEVQEQQTKAQEDQMLENQSQKVQQIEEQKQQPEPEVDDFYANIARQLALEIELEEFEDEEELKFKKEQEEKEKIRKQQEIENQEKNQKSQNHQYHHKFKSEVLDSSKIAIIQNKNIEDQDYTKKHTQQNSQTAIDLNRDSIAQSIESDNPKLKRFQSLNDTRDLRFDKNAKLQQMNSKNLELQEQLNLAKQQLESLGQIFIGKNGEGNIADAPLHLSFLFASPLVMRQNGAKGQNSSDNFNTVPLLEFNKEFKEIKGSIKETKRHLRIRAKQATIENLSLILSQNPLALHFSGHGIENNKENFGRQFKQRQNDGNYLLFETEDGEGELVSEKMLQEFMQSSNTRLEFVFVASCYSEFAGRIFLNAGAKHVICVRSGEQIADLAVITFSKSFYNSVFSQTMTICDAFKMAQKQVQVKYGLGESNKFSILVNDHSNSPDGKQKVKVNNQMDSQSSFKSQNSQESHKCKVFGPLKNGDPEFLETKPRFKEYPAKVDNFIGRQKEMFEVVNNVLNHRLVNIIGLPGIGKTSLSKNAVHYIVDRKIFKQGVVFMQLKGYISFELFMKKLVVNFVMQNFDLDKDRQKEIMESNIEQLLTISLKYLKNQEDDILLVFDNVEDLLYHDKKAFRIFINDLLVSVQNLHVLMTSRTTLGTLQDIQEKILVLSELSPFYTVDLFISRSRVLKDEEIKELLEFQPENQLLVGDMAYQKNQKVKNLAEHHLFKIFGGNPHAITLAAPLLIRMSLKKLYMLLNTKEMYDVLKVDGIEDSTVASLRLSLEVSIKVLQKEDLQALQFFFLIGLLPGGIEESELSEIWGADFKRHLESLMNLSLIQKKETKGSDIVKYILPPFMSNYADAKISQEDKVLFQNDICYYYAKICKNIYQSNGKSTKNGDDRTSELNHQVMEKLLKHETNIYACIYRMVDANPQTRIMTDQLDDDDDDNNPLDYLNQQSQRLNRLSTLMKRNETDFKRSQTANQVQMNKNDLIRHEQILNAQKLTCQADTADARPFQIMASQTPRTEDNKHFMFPVENERQTMSLLSPRSKIIDEENESLNSDLSNEDNEAQEIPTNKNKQEKHFNQSVLETSYQQDALNHIIRNSVVNFQRQSFNPGFNQLMQMMKNPELEKKSYLRRQTLFRTDNHKNSFMNLSSTLKKKAKIEELHAAEQLIIFYGMNLFLLHENDSALHLINNLALKSSGSTLYEANIYRIQGLIHHNKNDIEEALQSFKKAKKLFTQAESQYGIALSKFSIGYIYRSKIAEFIIKLDEEVILKRSKANFEIALVLFKTMNHVVGEALCHQQLSFISKSLKIKQDSTDHAKQHQRLMIQYTKYAHKKDCPFIPRVHGNEISLMTEIVFDNETKNMFPPVSQTKRKTATVSNQKFGDLQMPSEPAQLAHHSSLQIDPSELMFTPKLQAQGSMFVQETSYSPIKNQDKIGQRSDSLSSTDIAQEVILQIQDSYKYQPKHSTPTKTVEILTDSPQELNTDEGQTQTFQTAVNKVANQTTPHLNILNKQQSLQMSNKITKMISTLDIVDEEDELIRPSTSVLTVESKRQSIIFQDSSLNNNTQTSPLIRSGDNSFIYQSLPSHLPLETQSSLLEDYQEFTSVRNLTVPKLDGINDMTHRKKSFDKNKGSQGDESHTLKLDAPPKKYNHSTLAKSTSPGRIIKSTPKKTLNTTLISPKRV